MIEASKISQFVSSSKSCKVNDKGAKLEARFGSVTFDLSELNADKCDIYCKRISGNGKIVVRSGEKTNSNKVLSKISQKICVDINGKIDIYRPNDGDGEVLIFRIDVYNNPISGDGVLAASWKEIIRKCGKYNKLRLIGDKLYVTVNGYIEDNYKITQIETNPDNRAVRDDNKIKFTESCEIIKIVLSDSSSVVQPIIQPFINRNPPTQIFKPKQDVIDDAIKQVKETGLISKEEVITLGNNDNIIFNSGSNRGFANYSCNSTGAVKSIRSNGREYIILRKGGSCCIPISSLKGNSDYICIIKGKKLNGNGKFYVNLVTTDSDFEDMTSVVLNNGMSDRQVGLTTKPTEHGKIHKIHLAMLDNCVGEVLIENILIIEGVAFSRHVNRPYFSTPSIYKKSNFSHIVDYNFNTNEIYLAAKKYAKYEYIDKVKSRNFDIKGNLASSTVSGTCWLSKILPFFPEVKLSKDIDNLNNSLLISSMGSIHPAKSIWVEPFKEEEISNNEIERLKQCSNIFTPSNINYNFIKEECHNSNVKLLCRYLPYLTPKENPYFNNKNYILSFCREKYLVDKLINLWNPDMPKLALVGARGRYPDYIIPVNEYLSFDELIYVILKSKGVIDLYNGPQYESAFADLIISLGVPIISNNWNIINNNNAVFVPNLDRSNKYPAPNQESIFDAINKLSSIKTKTFNTDEYLNKFNNSIKELFI
jgi:hypothetical protein